MAFVTWTPATRCTEDARPGARALQKVILERHPKGSNLGIFNCRTVRGGSTTSKHGEGRAGDVGFAMYRGRGTKVGHALVKELIEHGERLGLEAVIYDRTIWSAKSPGGRPYTGVHPHYDHVHWEISRHAAETLTVERVREILGDVKPATTPDEAIDGAVARPAPKAKVLPTLSRGDSGDYVAFLQRFLAVKPAIGQFGPRTARAVRRYQRRHKLTVDGVVGPNTWAEIAKGTKLPDYS
jgi:hypothetical protein